MKRKQSKKKRGKRSAVGTKNPKPMTKKQIAAVNKKIAKGREKPEPTMLKSSKSVKHAMELLDDTFSYLKQRPPVMNTTLEDPSSQFLIETYALVAKWPEGVLRQFIEELTNLTAPKDVAGMLGTVKRIIHEVFGDTGYSSGATYLARWRMWPHRRNKVEEDGVKSRNEAKENKMAKKMTSKLDKTSKMAVKKKVSAKKTSVKKSKGKKERSGSRGAALTPDTRLIRKAAKTDESALWTKFLAAMGAKEMTFGALCTAMKKALKMDAKKVRRITLSLRRRSLIVSRDE